MKKAHKHTSNKPSKGARLRWASLKEGASVKITTSMVNGHAIPESEIKTRQHSAGNDNISLLVP
jgi:hypothetical protein